MIWNNSAPIEPIDSRDSAFRLGGRGSTGSFATPPLARWSAASLVAASAAAANLSVAAIGDWLWSREIDNAARGVLGAVFVASLLTTLAVDSARDCGAVSAAFAAVPRRWAKTRR